ncbi:MAG: hypothetical protein DLM53_01960 [Candidatus Eremiobacter antarcticus]|nr:translocation/assembly module TamB domain-containing protein [Candidatus Eremiobacteraeota bacterium]MBC5808171.1 translocation/assembly module TamB domain-containing protein [Candidatus Eremiobacteraeota bacterium]PZR63565.1 MAG: hypothetical protein DLM53_01960 [Candidatus Eremiobacter sp. RRmetagenome_bin22]
MRAFRKFAVVAGIAVIALLLIIALALTLSWPRSALVSSVFGFVVAQRGLHVTHGQLTVHRSVLTVADLHVKDDAGEELLRAKKLVVGFDAAGIIGRGDRRFGLKAIALQDPVLRLIRRKDGSWNLSALRGPAAPAGGPAPTAVAAPYRVRFEIHNGEVQVIDPQALVKFASRFTLAKLNAVMDFNEGAVSTGHLGARLITSRGSTIVYGNLFEDDEVSFARAHLQARGVAIAPVIGALLPSKAFALDAGRADVRLNAYALDYPSGSQAAWHVSGDATVSAARLRIVPLILPVRNLVGPMHFQDGLLSTGGMTATAAGTPLAVKGALELYPAVRSALWIRQRGDLRTARLLLAFSRSQPVAGAFSATLRLDGPLDDPHLTGAVVSDAASYAGVALHGLSSALYYQGSHLTVSAFDRATAGPVWLHGDLAIGGASPQAQALVQASLLTAELPVLGNLNSGGRTQALVSLAGPVARIAVRGYAQMMGGNGARLRTRISAGPGLSSVGPFIYRSDEGELSGIASVAKNSRGRASVSAEMFADHARVHMLAGRIAMPDIAAVAVALPALDGVFDGVAFISTGENLPAVAVNASANNIVLSGIDLGSVAVRAGGQNGRIGISDVMVAGRDLSAHATGTAAVDSGLALRAAALRGDATADLTALSSSAQGGAPRMSGSGRGKFFATVADGRWVISTTLASSDAQIAGIALRSGAATASGGGGSATQVLANVGAAGGIVSAVGNIAAMSGSGSGNGTFEALLNSVDLSKLRSFGVPLQRGTATAIASVSGGAQSPSIAGGAVFDGFYGAVPLSGDLDASYGAGVVRTDSSRVTVDGNRATISGDVSGLQTGSPAGSGNAVLHLAANLREADLAGLNRWTPVTDRISGAADADLHLTGTIGRPRVKGYVDTDLGTIRGVAFDELHGDIGAAPGSASLQNGTLRFGTSQFHLSGATTGNSVSARVQSDRVDMADFNDFFGGADVFAGVGPLRIALTSGGGELNGNGHVRFDDAALRGYALGHVESDFSSLGGKLIASLRQDGPGGAASVAGTVGFAPHSGPVPQLATAQYNLKARLQSLDVDRILPFINQEELGVGGKLEAAGTLTGSLRRPVARMNFTLHDGHVRKLAIQSFSGALQSDAFGVALQRADLALPFLTASAQGRYRFAHRSINGAASFHAADLASVARALAVPGTLTGSADATVSVAGTLDRPKLAASVHSGAGSVYGVGLQDSVANVSYAPGELSIGDTSVTFAGRGGQLRLRGAMPLQLRPFALGPPARPVNIAMEADSVNLAAFNPVSDRFATLGGTLNSKVTITGSAGHPSVAGTAGIRDGSVRSTFETTPFTNVSADLTLQSDTIALRKLHGSLGSGSLDMQGQAHIVPAVGLRSNAGLQYYSRVAFHNANLNVPGWIGGDVDGDLSLTQSGVTPFLSGGVTLNNTSVPFSAILAIAQGGAGGGASQQTASAAAVPGVPPLQPGHTIVYGGAIYGDATHTVTNATSSKAAATGFSLPPVDLNLAVKAGKDVRVRGGSAIDLTAAGGVTIGGNVRAPTLAGEFSAIRGQVGYFDTTFRLLRGTVTFDPVQGLLPTLDASAVTNVGGAEITLTLSGRVDNLSTDLSSSPPMSRDEIVAALLHAPQVTALTSSPDQAQATLVSTAQSYFNAELTRSLLFPFESALAQSLNIEQISLVFDQQGNLALEVRTKFTPQISALYRSSLNVPATQTYGVSYRLRDYLALELLESQPTIGTQTGIVSLRYAFH